MRYERSYGQKCESTRNKPLTEIAKLIRMDIKVAKNEGKLPADFTCSVRSDRGTAIDLRWAVSETAVFEPGMYGFDLNEKGREIQDLLEEIHGSYNYDGSDIQTDYFDVRYYGNPAIDWQLANKPDAKLVSDGGWHEGIDIEMLVTLVRDGRYYDEAVRTTEAMQRLDAVAAR